MLNKEQITFEGKTLDVAEFSNAARWEYEAYAQTAGYKALGEAIQGHVKILSDIDDELKSPKRKLLVTRLERQIESKQIALDEHMASLTSEEWTDEVQAELMAEAEVIENLEANLKKLNNDEALEGKLKAAASEVDRIRKERTKLDYIFVCQQYDIKPKDEPSDEMLSKAENIVKKVVGSQTLLDSSLALNRQQRRQLERQTLKN